MKAFSLSVFFILLCALNVNAKNILNYICEFTGLCGNDREVVTSYGDDLV